MSKTLTIDIPDGTAAALQQAEREEGLDEGELVRIALDDYLAVRKFRRLRERMMALRPDGFTDEDVFERVS
jgi:hypothetical protein